MKLKLAPKLALVFFLFGLGMLIGVGIQGDLRGRAAIQAATMTELESSAGEKEAALEGWLLEQQSDLQALSKAPHMINGLSHFREGGPDLGAARDQLIEELSVYAGADRSFLSLFILSPEEGQVIISTDPQELGASKADYPYFIKGKITAYTTAIYYSPELQAPAITTATPLRSENGQLLGVLVGRLNLEELHAIVRRRSGWRETDDAYLVNNSHLFVTQPRLTPNPAVLRLGEHSESVERCLEGQRGTISTEDYRGVPVIAAYRWLPEREMCLIVSMEQEEAFAAVRELEKIIRWIALGTLLMASLVSMALSRVIVAPIMAMQRAAQRYGRGELDVRLPETRSDELGVLAHEFNQMAELLSEKERELRAHAETLEQKIQERTQALQESHNQLQWAESIGGTGSWEWWIPENRVTWSDGLYRIFGFMPQEFEATYESYLERAHPADREQIPRFMQVSSYGKEPFEFENRILRKDGQIRNLYNKCQFLTDESGKAVRVIGIAIDITERKRAEADLHRITEDLRRSNAELEQFAYVASHDLQEPLRMIASYVQLLAKRYQGKLDSDADEFIAFAVEGAKRMQNLINDLLAYSRVGTRGSPFTLISSEDLLRDALANLQFMIEESGAKITHEPLPVIKGDAIQLVMVFQNLLSNAMKFRGSEPLCIHVGVRWADDKWIFSVRDNGIGIDPKFAERIFVIFQRLNDRASYPGTGIGLAICKRIILRHGGCIWVESEVQKGATFYFILPAKETL